MLKKLWTIILPLLALAACEKSIEEQEIPQPPTTEDTFEFTASMEQIGGNTKTALGSNLDILWQTKELIYIYCKKVDAELYELKKGEGTTSATFGKFNPNPVKADPMDHFVAISPAVKGDINKIRRNGNVYIFDYFALPDVQKYVQDSYDPDAFPMIAISETDVLPFKNAAGILKLQIKGSSVIKSITLSTSKTITGKTNITSDAVLTLTGEGGKSSLLMDCGQSGVQLDEMTATAFHFVLPPVDLSGGFTVEIVDNANGHMIMKAPAGLEQNKIERNRILSMPEFTYKAAASVPVPATNEIVVRMADPTKEPTDITSQFSKDFDKVKIREGYWKYVHKLGPLTDISYSYFNVRSINFEEMILPEGLVTIGPTAFRDDNFKDDNYFLKKIVLPTTLKTIGIQAFENSKALEEIVFNDPERSQLESIGNDAFRNCVALQSVALPNNLAVPEFHFSGFRECTNLASINIPDNTTTIGFKALQGTALKTLTLPTGVTTLGENAFDSMLHLEKAVICEGVTDIPSSLFGSCSNLSSLTLPSTVKTIGDYFIAGTEITSLDLPEGLEEIVHDAFAVSQLTSFTIPSTVKTIGNKAIQSNAAEFTVTFKAPKAESENFDGNCIGNAYNCHLKLHSSRKDEVNGLRWRNSAWDYKSITFIDDSGNVVNP